MRFANPFTLQSGKGSLMGSKGRAEDSTVPQAAGRPVEDYAPADLSLVLGFHQTNHMPADREGERQTPPKTEQNQRRLPFGSGQGKEVCTELCVPSARAPGGPRGPPSEGPQLPRP